MEILDPESLSIIDFTSFRTKIRHVLNASIRTARSSSNFAVGVELIAVIVAVLNFLYVLLLSSTFQAAWFDSVTFSGGAFISILGLTELIIRFNPFRIQNFTPITRLNETFDGLALLAACTSCVGKLW